MTSYNCRSCSAHFSVSDEDLEFYAKASLEYGGSKLQLPPPTHCPRCRLIRRAVWRNEYTYYSRNCPLCSARLISVHDSEHEYPVYCNSCWWDDSRDLREFGQEIDYTRPFFEQFVELQSRVPKPSMANDNHLASENIEYCQGLAYSKNCYLVTTAWRLEDSLYSANCGESKELVDCRFVGNQSEMAYECTTCQNINLCTFLDQSENCHDCHFGIDLKGCSHCIACFGLRQKRYCIFNEQYSKEEYQRRALKLELHSHTHREMCKKRFEEFISRMPRRGMNLINCESSTGNNLFNTKNFHGFNVFGGENCKFYYLGTRPEHCYDILVGGEHQWCYEGVNPDHSYMTHFTSWCWSDSYTLYSDNCHSSKHLFGCIGLRRKEYCILNKQYEPEEYAAQVLRLYKHMQETGEWGEFFPVTSSAFAYNESVAQDHFPLTKDQAMGMGYRWKDRPSHIPKESFRDIPDSIEETDDSITSKVLCCGLCQAGYKITGLEYRFYRKLGIPVPRSCPRCRRLDRFARSGSYELYDRTCGECGVAMKANYSSEEPELVVCESCYQRAIYS